MATSYNDMYVLTTSSNFQNRVGSALWQTCVNISNEGSNVANHYARDQYVAYLLANPTAAVTLFTNLTAVNAAVSSSATSGGTVTLSSANVATQQALVLDTTISAAISAAFNAPLGLP